MNTAEALKNQPEINEPCPVCMAAAGSLCTDVEAWISNPDAHLVALDYFHADRVQAYWFVKGVQSCGSNGNAPITTQQILNTGLV